MPGPMELLIIFAIVCVLAVPVLLVLYALLATRGQRGPGGAARDEELTQVLRELSAGLERMEQRLDSVEEVIGAGDAGKN